jgi:iron(III) transport system ATP-binding protein
MSGVAIGLDRVVRRYGRQDALADISFIAPAGKITALLGASGSGKSTILRLIAGLEPVDAGAIRFGETVVSTPAHTLAAEKRRVGFVFQDYALFPHMTARANVAFGLARNDHAKADLWLDRVGLADKAQAYPHMLSGGEQQRVALARALAPEPQIVLLDEPFSGLDPALRAELRDETLSALTASGATALFVTHDADEALYVGDQLVILKAGQLVQAGPPRTVYAAPTSRAAAGALGPVNRWDGIVRDGRVATPFGVVAAPGHAEDAAVSVIVRAEAIMLSAGADAVINARHAQGRFDLVMIEAGGVRWKAFVAADALADARAVAVGIDPAGAHVFAPA